MIVRDEAEVLGVALGSVRDWAAQVVVVDTGSSDGSIEVARRAGATIDTIEWRDDFAAARNASMELATQAWILVLDADEWIDPADVEALRRLVHGPADRAYRFAQRNYVDSAQWSGLVAGPIPPVWGLEAVGWVVAKQIRLVPNRPDVRYEEPVHETMTHALRRAGVEMVDADVPVHHVGKLRSAAIMARKKLLYKHLGEMKLQARPNGRALLELGIQCSELGEHEQARSLLGRAVEELGAGPDRARAVASLGTEIELVEGTVAAESYLRSRLASESRHPDVWERLGVTLIRGHRFARAAEVLERAVDLFPEATNLLRLAAEAELHVRQFARAAELFDVVRRISEGSELGVAGHAIARAAIGDADPVLDALEHGSPWLVSNIGRLARIHLSEDWILRAPPDRIRRTPRAILDDALERAYRARGRHAAALALRWSLADAPRSGLEAIVRASRAGDATATVEVGVHRVAGAPRWAALTRVPGSVAEVH